MVTRDAEGENPGIIAKTDITFIVTGEKLYESKLLHQFKTGFKRTIKWSKCRSEMSNQSQNNNLNYLIDPTFSKVNRLYVLPFENEDDRTFFRKYITSIVEIKDYNVVINGKKCFNVPIKNKKETYENIIEIGRSNDYTTGNLFDFEYCSNNFKLIAID